MNRITYLFTIILITLACLCFSAGSSAESQASVPDHSRFTQLLQQHVNEAGRVDYAALKQNRRPLEVYLQQLAQTDLDRLDSDADRIAFWINAYNAYTLKAIIDHYPVEPRAFGGWFAPDNSIKQIKGVWDKLQFKVAGRDLTLDAMEHEILRVDFDEPRIHFALVCASLSCPTLRREAYTGAELDSQLKDQTQIFLNNPDIGLDVTDSTVAISKIFDWYGKDFDADATSLPKFEKRSDTEAGVLRFLLTKVDHKTFQQLVRNDNFELEYLDYDWRLNDQNVDY